MVIPKNIPSGNDQEFASEHGHRNGESFHEKLIFFSYINVYQRVAFGHIRHGENKYWTKRLFTEAYFGSAMYKGSANGSDEPTTVGLRKRVAWYAKLANSCELFPEIVLLRGVHPHNLPYEML